MRWVFFIAVAAAAAEAGVACAQPGESSPDSRSAVREEPPLTPGFGENFARPAVPGFGADATGTGARNAGVALTDRYHERVVAYADQILERYDRNQSGKLERDEWASARWRSDPASSDANKDGMLTREELCERVNGYDEFRGLSGSAAATSSAGGSSTGDKAKLDEYAKGLLQRYDDNDNGVLEADEFAEMSSFHRGADANGDKVITRDELSVRLANYGSSSGTAPSSTGEHEREEPKTGSSPGDKGYRTAGDRASPRGFRVRTVIERLPKGLPDWFARNDADGDGQVSMAEFAVSWTDEKVAEFSEHDLNGDGLITPQECIEESRHRRDAGATDAGATRDGGRRGR